MKLPQQTELADQIYQQICNTPGKERHEIVEVLRGKVKAGTIQCYLDKMRKAGYVMVSGKGYHPTNNAIKHLKFSDINKPIKGRTTMNPLNNTPAATTPPAEPQPPRIEQGSKQCTAQDRPVVLTAVYSVTVADMQVTLSHAEARALKKQLDSVLAV